MAKKPNILLVCAGLVVLTIAAYEPMRHNEFVDYDDDRYVTENRHVNRGITRKSLLWVFTTPHASMWHPLTSLSHMTDCELFGLNALGHHLTNLLLHIANTLLLFLILKRVTGAIWASAFVAAVFALHPLNVESVAWVAEHKNVLSTFFWMLTIASYIRYAQCPAVGRYLIVAFVFCLALMSKPMVVTLPFVLLLLDYWPLCRLQWPGSGEREVPPQSESTKTEFQHSSFRRLVVEKIPLFIFSAVLCVITLITQHVLRDMKTAEKFALDIRISNALVSYLQYIGKMFYPRRLALLYLHPGDSLSMWQPIISFLILAGISALILYQVRRRRWLVVGWLWYIGTLVPAIGLVQVGKQAMADRYTYLPLIGIFIIFAWGIAELTANLRYRKIVLWVSAGLVLIALLICTRMQVRHWKNDFSLYGHTIAVTENNYFMLNNYGSLFRNKNEFDEAITYFNEAVRINPDFVQGYYNLGIAFSGKGNIEETIANYTKALTLNPRMWRANFNLGNIYWNMNKADDAISYYSKALEIEPNHPELNLNMGLILAEQGKYEKSIEHFNEVLRVEPNWFAGYKHLGQSYAQLGMYDPAIENYKKALVPRNI